MEGFKAVEEILTGASISVRLSEWIYLNAIEMYCKE
jgi:hypothetical protein